MASDGNGSDDNSKSDWLETALRRHLSVLHELESRTTTDHSDADRCLIWLALERQVRAGMKGIEELSTATADSEVLSRHRVALQEMLAGAQSELAHFDLAVRHQAVSALGVRVAVIGKGGAGKTLVSSTLARTLARRGRKVLAVDLDPNPGLTYGLGMPLSDAGFPPEAFEAADDGTWMSKLAPSLGPLEVVERFSDSAPDGVRYLGLGKITDPERNNMRRTLNAMFQVLLNFAEPGWDVIGDLEGGTNTPYQGYCRFADRVLLVVGPSWKSALTARRLLGLIGSLPVTIVSNRFGEAEDHPDLAPEIRIPFDQEVAEADRKGVALVDHCPGSPAVRAIEDLADMLTHKEGALL